MKGFLKFITVLIIIVVLAAGVGYVLLSFGSKVNVEWTQADYDSLVSKIGVKVENLSDLNIENIANDNFSVKGAKPVDASITSLEFSAMVASANDESGPLKNFRMDFTNNDELEMSFKLPPNIGDLFKEADILGIYKTYRPTLIFLSLVRGNVLSLTESLVKYLSGLVENKPIFASGSLIRTSRNEVSVDIVTLKVGSIPLPEDTINNVEDATETFINNFITSANGFSIEELRIEDGKIYYKGTLPSEIEGIPLG